MFEGYNFNDAPECYSDEDVVTAWLTACVDESSASAKWAFPELDDLIRDEPERAWRIIVALAERVSTPEAKSLLAAGPIENLLSQHGPAFIDRVEQRAQSDAGFNYLLGGVWRFEMTDDIWDRLQAARTEVW
jgi:hypothetical protein